MNQVDPLAEPFFLSELGSRWCNRLQLDSVWHAALPWDRFQVAAAPLLALGKQRDFEEALILPSHGLQMLARLDPLVRVMWMAHGLGITQRLSSPLMMQVHDEQPQQASALRLDAPAGSARPV